MDASLVVSIIAVAIATFSLLVSLFDFIIRYQDRKRRLSITILHSHVYENPKSKEGTKRITGIKIVNRGERIINIQDTHIQFTAILDAGILLKLNNLYIKNDIPDVFFGISKDNTTKASGFEWNLSRYRMIRGMYIGRTKLLVLPFIMNPYEVVYFGVDKTNFNQLIGDTAVHVSNKIKFPIIIYGTLILTDERGSRFTSNSTIIYTKKDIEKFIEGAPWIKVPWAQSKRTQQMLATTRRSRVYDIHDKHS